MRTKREPARAYGRLAMAGLLCTLWPRHDRACERECDFGSEVTT